jgi:predicted transcriptional regulator
MMDRMAAKGLLRTEKVRNLTLFRAAIKQGDAQKSAVRSTLEKAFNGALTPFVQCLLESEKITPGELAELEKLIKAKKQPK